MSTHTHIHGSSCDHSHDHSTDDTATSTSKQITSEELRALQAPIKDKYKNDPASALVTLKSEGTLSGTGIACKLSTSTAAQRIAGLHPAAGGPEASLSGELCSGDLLLEALVACAGVTLKAVATAFSLGLVDGEVVAEGDLDFRGTLGVDREAPVGFKEIRLSFFCTFDHAISEAEIEKLGKLTERYCVVLQTICVKPVVKVGLRGTHEEGGVERSEAWFTKK